MSLPPRQPPLPWHPEASARSSWTLADLRAARWTEHPQNPLIQPPPRSPLLADPTFLAPGETPDERWHLYAHSIFGLHHHVSDDGVVWTRQPGVVTTRALRPFLFRDQGRYHLLYEKTRWMQPWLPWRSHLEIRSSSDLRVWSEPQILLRPCLPWHHQGDGAAVGGPCVIRAEGRYRLYYGGGQAPLEGRDARVPWAVGAAEASALTGPWRPLAEPLLRPATPAQRAGALTVLPVADGYAGFQPVTDVDAQGTAAIRLLLSADGLGWEALPTLVRLSAGWSAGRLGALDVRPVGDTLRLYVSARAGAGGREAVGLVLGTRAASAV